MGEYLIYMGAATSDATVWAGDRISLATLDAAITIARSLGLSPVLIAHPDSDLPHPFPHEVEVRRANG